MAKSCTVKPLRTTTAGKVPTTSEIEDGEICINLADKKIYMRNGSNIVQLGGDGFTIVRITDSDSPYSVPSSGNYIIKAIKTTTLTINMPEITSSNNNQRIIIHTYNGYPTVNAYSGQKIHTNYDQDTVFPYQLLDAIADSTLRKWLALSS